MVHLVVSQTYESNTQTTDSVDMSQHTPMFLTVFVSFLFNPSVFSSALTKFVRFSRGLP